VAGEAAQSPRERRVAYPRSESLQRRRRGLIQLFLWTFFSFAHRRAGLHAHPYSSKFPPLPGEFVQHIGRALAQQRCRGAAGSDELELLGPGIGDTDVGGKRRRQRPAQSQLQAELALPAALEVGQRGLGFQYLP
jgi:hypothetical protein